MKKNQTIKLAKDLTIGSIGLGVGASLAGKLSSGAPAGVSKNIGSAFEIGSMALPIMAAGRVMKSTKMLEDAVKEPKRKKPKRGQPKWI